MKILHVIPHFLPSKYFGGTPWSCFNLAQAQATLGHDVSVLTTDVFSQHKRYFQPEEKMTSVRIYRLRNLSNIIAYIHKLSSAPFN